jgi:hypothetical protein
MKKLITITLLFIATFSFAQTSMTEYNYISLGYKDNVAKGQDIKSGYRIEEKSTYAVKFFNEKKQEAQRKVTFYNFYRTGETSPCGTLMKTLRTDNKVELYLCIPTSNSSKEVWDKCWTDYEKFTTKWNDISLSYSWSMLRFISEINTK